MLERFSSPPSRSYQGVILIILGGISSLLGILWFQMASTSHVGQEYIFMSLTTLLLGITYLLYGIADWVPSTPRTMSRFIRLTALTLSAGALITGIVSVVYLYKIF